MKISSDLEGSEGWLPFISDVRPATEGLRDMTVVCVCARMCVCMPAEARR